MEQPDVETGATPAVKSIRSKFEQLARTSSTRPLSAASNGDNALLIPEPGSPRPRAASGSYAGGQVREEQHLRTSSSSSDLKTGTRRPPPPPPSRRPRDPTPGQTPVASPLLRPVPIPVVPLSANQPGPHSKGPIPSISLVPQTGAATAPGVSTVTPLKGRYKPPTSPPKAYTQRQSLSGQLETNVARSSSIASPKPTIPPRPPKSTINQPFHLSPSRTLSPEPIAPLHASNNSSLGLESPFLDVEDSDQDQQAPALPLRRSPNHIHSKQDSYSSSGTHSSESSLMSSDADGSSVSSLPPPISSLPPRPPPRNRASVYPSSSANDSYSSSSLAPPPLPVRPSTIAQIEERSPPPRLPGRPYVAIPAFTPPSENASVSPSVERKVFGSKMLPPPPTRTIALGDKLPPPRRPPSPSSDEDSGEEDDPRSHLIDKLPDSSRSSRRPPAVSFAFPYSEIRVPAHAGHVAVSGTCIVVTSPHHIRVYDLSVSEAPKYALDTKEIGLKDIKITSVEFRATANQADRGFLVWLGTKEGHLFEFDTRSGCVTGSKFSAHSHTVTHIFRHGHAMVSLDSTGKVLVFVPEGEDVSLTYTTPRVVRIPEKQAFAAVLGGRLWTSTRSDQHAGSKTPIIRVHDIFVAGGMGRSVLPTEHVGPVTSATVLPSDPLHAYLGHEEGFITVWQLESDTGYPKCIEVMKVSMSDVMSLEGVNDRLWAGGRNGHVSAYDVTTRPWVVTNAWAAHGDLPVLKLAVDHYGIEKTGRLCVVSVGRDEQIKFWDGLLGASWIDRELAKREPSFSRCRDLKILLISWNVDAAKPEALTGDAATINFLQDALRSVESPDIISFGFQEVIDLESRKMVAKNVLLSGKRRDDGGLSERVTGAYRRWHDHFMLAVRLAMPPEVPYSIVQTESLVGLFSCIFVKSSERTALKDQAIATIKRGMGGRYGNKGGIVARFVVEDSSICLINCHLAAGQHAIRQRNADVAAMLEEKSVFPSADHPVAYVGGGDGSMVLDHEIVLVNGDMNYRIDQRRDNIVASVRSGDIESLFSHDQLLKEMKFNRGFRFRGFSEGPLTFAPTYKYDRRSTEYDSSEKRRAPAWCDRVLWRSHIAERVRQLHYRRYEAMVSDHRPVTAGFVVTVKSVRHEVRQRVENEVGTMWGVEHARLLAVAKEFYVQQKLLI